ncbi:MAG TPA: hypothetical protein VLT33_41795 [Labilithrix sp.]|nr:hypothetical protein [Labilithrix sp.]
MHLAVAAGVERIVLLSGRGEPGVIPSETVAEPFVDIDDIADVTLGDAATLL